MRKIKLVLLIALLMIVLALGLLRRQLSFPIKADSANSEDLIAFNKKIGKPTQIEFGNFVHYNFIELDKIAKISKFRSGVGHDFSKGPDESCRSMKHYFEPIGIDSDFWHRFHNGQFSKSEWPTVSYFAPVSGKIIDVRSAKNVFGDEEKQFIIQSAKNPDVWFEFFHIITNLTIGSQVEGGEFLGTISPGNSGEIAVDFNGQLISFFDLIDEAVFSEYKVRGIKSRQELIITKQEREENPLQCDARIPHRFIGSNISKSSYDFWSMGKDNWVFLKPPKQSKKILETLLPGVYENMTIELLGNTIINSGEQLIILNSRIDLNNHSLIFRDGSKAEIRNSIILNSSEEYWDGYVSRHPDDMDGIMPSEKGWGIKPSAGFGIETDNFVLDSSEIKNSYGHGLYFYYAKSPKITNSRFINNAWTALRSEGSWGIYFSNNTLIGNAWQNPEKVGFAQLDVSGGGNLSFSYNKISSIIEGAVCFYGQQGIIIEQNMLDDTILLDDCSNCTINSNKAKQMSLYGCKAIEMQNNTIENIQIYENSGPSAWQ